MLFLQVQNFFWNLQLRVLRVVHEHRVVGQPDSHFYSHRGIHFTTYDAFAQMCRIFFPSLANVNTECRELLLCNHALRVWQERENCAICFSPQLGASVAAAAFLLFRITLPV